MRGNARPPSQSRIFSRRYSWLRVLKTKKIGMMKGQNFQDGFLNQAEGTTVECKTGPRATGTGPC